MEDKANSGGVDPFTKRREEKRLFKEKENLKQIKNDLRQNIAVKNNNLATQILP